MIAPLRSCVAQRAAASALPGAAGAGARRSAAVAAPVSLRALSTSGVRLSAGSGEAAGAAAASEYANIKVSDAADGKVRVITLHRPKALNALNSELFHELNDATAKADSDASVGAIVLTGSEKAFAAGADIKEMKDMHFSSAYKNNFLGHWTQILTVRKPIIAAVSGYALGGGCELAMMCDIILASPTANFGQPEINLGVIPGAGGSQRLTKAIGKSLAMEIVLTGRNVTAEEAVAHGLASRIVPAEEGSVVDAAVKLGATIAKKGQIATQAAKEAVNAAYELPLTEGLRFERRLFQSLFATKDQKEGMSAFAEKRKAQFTNE